MKLLKFKGTAIPYVEHNEGIWLSVRHICEGIGIQYPLQYEVLMEELGAPKPPPPSEENDYEIEKPGKKIKLKWAGKVEDILKVTPEYKILFCINIKALTEWFDTIKLDLKQIYPHKDIPTIAKKLEMYKAELGLSI